MLAIILKLLYIIGLSSCLYGGVEILLSIKTYPKDSKDAAFPLGLFPERFRKEIEGSLEDEKKDEKTEALAVLDPKHAKEGILFIIVGFIAQLWATLFLSI